MHYSSKLNFTHQVYVDSQKLAFSVLKWLQDKSGMPSESHVAALAKSFGTSKFGNVVIPQIGKCLSKHSRRLKCAAGSGRDVLLTYCSPDTVRYTTLEPRVTIVVRVDTCNMEVLA